jgi:hypothetical protein
MILCDYDDAGIVAVICRRSRSLEEHMPSDTLAESVANIAYYQRGVSDTYEPLSPRIEFVKSAMSAVQAELDFPFGFATRSSDAGTLTLAQAKWFRHFCSTRAERWKMLSAQATAVCGVGIERWTSLLRRLDGHPVG